MSRLLAVVMVLSLHSWPAAVAQDSAPDEVKVAEWSGTFVPVGGESVSVETEEWSKGLEFIEVVDHGTVAEKGDLLARLDTEGIDEAIVKAQIDLETATIARDHAELKARLDVEKEEAALTKARVALRRARKALEGWKKFELEFARRDIERRRKGQQDRIDDQRDELNQLEAMYSEDELTDETEEIVLARSRRSLAMAIDSMKLSEARREYTKAYQDPIKDEDKHEVVVVAERALKHLETSTEMARRSRKDSMRKTERSFEKAETKLQALKEERERFRIVAPRAGVVLHGDADDYRPGRVAPRHEVGRAASPGATLLTMVDADTLALALDLPEADLPALRQGMAVRVVPVRSPDRSQLGRMTWERFPTPTKGSNNTFAARVEFDSGWVGLVAGMRAKVTAASEDPATGR